MIKRLLLVVAGGIFPSLTLAQPATQPTDAALLAKIAALPDNTWLKLPPFKTAGDLAWCGQPDWPNTEDMPKYGPGVRDYCNKMAWAPDRARALYCGGNHQTPHYINDVWEYDLASNTWICLFAPDPQYPRKLKEIAVFKDGFIQTRRGGPLRPCHTWWGLCYDAQTRRLLWLEPHQGLVFIDSKRVAAELGIDLAEAQGAQGGPKTKTKPGWYIWSFDPAAGKWDGVRTGVPVGGEAATLEYLPDRKTCWLVGYTYPLNWERTSGLFDFASGKFTPLTAGKSLPSAETVIAYDPAKKQAVAVLGSKTWTYSFQTDTWKLAQAAAPVSGSDSRSFFCFDPVVDRYILYTRMEASSTQPAASAPAGGLWLYDLENNRWAEPKAGGNVPPRPSRLAGYYDPVRNVTVLYTGREVWVYRARRMPA